MFEDQYVELLPARTTMQTTTVVGAGGNGGAGGAGGFAAALSAALNLQFAEQTATAVSVGGDATAGNVAATGDATAADATATAGAGGALGAACRASSSCTTVFARCLPLIRKAPHATTPR